MNEKNRKCFKCGSKGNDDNKLFRFPKPGVANLIRCLLWAQFILPDKQYSSIELQRKLYNQHRMLCQKHFKDADFTDKDKTKLLRTAVPCDVFYDERTKKKIKLSCEESAVFSLSTVRTTESKLEEAEDAELNSDDDVSDAIYNDDTSPAAIGYSREIETYEILESPPAAASPASVVPNESMPCVHEGFSCNICHGEIVGFRYTCVQCADFDLCSSCEARGAHDQHYVLRIPGPRPYSEVQKVLDYIRSELMKEGVQEKECEDDIVANIEIKKEVNIESEIKEEIDLEPEIIEEFDLGLDPLGIASEQSLNESESKQELEEPLIKRQKRITVESKENVDTKDGTTKDDPKHDENTTAYSHRPRILRIAKPKRPPDSTDSTVRKSLLLPKHPQNVPNFDLEVTSTKMVQLQPKSKDPGTIVTPYKTNRDIVLPQVIDGDNLARKIVTLPMTVKDNLSTKIVIPNVTVKDNLPRKIVIPSVINKDNLYTKLVIPNVTVKESRKIVIPNLTVKNKLPRRVVISNVKNKDASFSKVVIPQVNVKNKSFKIIAPSKLTDKDNLSKTVVSPQVTVENNSPTVVPSHATVSDNSSYVVYSHKTDVLPWRWS